MTDTSIEIDLLPCRKCGSTDIELWDGKGTQAEMSCNECGQSDGLQVSDRLTYEERYSGKCDFSMETLCYPSQVIAMAKTELRKEWNRRIYWSDGSRVRIPTSADEAAMMCLLGKRFLKEHAPERLKENALEFPDNAEEQKP